MALVQMSTPSGSNARPQPDLQGRVLLCQQFKIMAELIDLVGTDHIRADTRVGYMFAGYMYAQRH